MKKRILSIVLTLCMLLMLVPATVFAEGGISHDGWTELTKDILESNYKYDSSYYRLPSGDYYLGEDISVDKTVQIGDQVNTVDVTLDLNGYVINMIDLQNTASESVIEVREGSNLTLHDSRPTATHTDATLPAGGVITRENRTFGVGGGVNVSGGSFTMNSGTIYNCRAEGGGGVAVDSGSFTMNGGTIYNCRAHAGGGVNVSGGSFTMNGGSIYGCSAEMWGDAVYSNRISNIYANGGTIKGTVDSYGKILNTATDGGCTRFYDEVTNATTSLGDHGTISGGIYYGGISGGGTVEGTYHTVSFDLNGGSGSIPKQWFVNIDTAQALEPAAPTRENYEFAGWYNEDTKYDFTQNVTENITLTAHWESVEVPVIIGLENGKTYCDAVEFEVTDNVGVASVTAGGVELSPTNGKYTLEKGIGTVTVVAIDNADNETTVTVTVNNGHTAGNDDGNCSTPVYCIYHPDTIVIEAKSHDFSGDWHKNETSHCHICQNEGCTVTDTPIPHSGTDDGDCTTAVVCECGYIITAANAEHTFSGNTCTACGYTKPSSGGGVSTYAITVENAENGTVTMTPKTASKGTTVTLTVEPDKGYTLETLTVTDKNGNEIELTNKGDGKYTFKMPGSKVTVEATFMEDNSMLNFFVDVPADAYYYDAVLWAAENGITGGVDDTHFAPNAPCTRAQIVTFLWRAAGSPVVNYAMNFSDVPADAYYAEAVRWAVSQGITKGTSDTTFGPDATCTRAQAMTFLYRSEQAQGGGMQGAWMFLNPFSDVDLENYYGEAVMWAVANGITDGTTATTFSPGADCTRAQIVTFLFRCLGGE